MTEKKLTPAIIRTTCNGCGGSGQIGFFRGVSRFVMDWDDCPDCHGTGIAEHPAAGQDSDNKPSGDTSDQPSTMDNAPTPHHAEQTTHTGNH